VIVYEDASSSCLLSHRPFSWTYVRLSVMYHITYRIINSAHIAQNVWFIKPTSEQPEYRFTFLNELIPCSLRITLASLSVMQNIGRSHAGLCFEFMLFHRTELIFEGQILVSYKRATRYMGRKRAWLHVIPYHQFILQKYICIPLCINNWIVRVGRASQDNIC
jgi:hypothetical protein